MGSNQWILKTFALLHDPPHKPLVLGRDHAEIGRRIAAAITGREIEEPEKRAIEEADHIASGADRAQFLRDLVVDPRRELTMIHPLDGTTLARERDGALEFAEVPIRATEVDAARETVEGPTFQAVFQAIPDDEIRYLVLWRFGTEVLRDIEGTGGERLGALWDVLPADTRMPHHPLAAHNSLVAAVAPILAQNQDIALLRLAVGPVQPFIEAARSLADLWAGSYLLSSLVFEAMVPIIEAHGPDSILFPQLRWQALFDRWLAKRIQERGVALPDRVRECIERANKRAEEHGLRIPSLPNLFVAIVPWDEAETMARTCEKRVRETVRGWAEQWVAQWWLDADPDTVVGRARAQWEDLVEVYWAVRRWPRSGDVRAALDGAEAWPLWVAQRVRKTLDRVANLPGYRPNAGVWYPVVAEAASAVLDSAKRDRLGGRTPRIEGGLKCSVCGEREVLGGTDFYEQRGLWREKSAGSKNWVKDNEALCGVCLVKRLVGRKGPEGSRNWRHPSTTEIATSRTKMGILEWSRRDEEVREAVVELVRAAQREPDADDLRVFTLPAVLQAAGDDGMLAEFAHLDGDILLSIERHDQETQQFREKRQRFLRVWENATRESSDLPSPSPYLAVVVFDGDEVGKWLSGEKAPSWWDMLHPKARAQLAPFETVLQDLKRPVTPAIHAAMSQVCASFAQYAAPFTIEREGLPGHLVYAGGDDVLFLGPPLDALRLVWRLRLRFSGFPDRIRPDNDPDPQGGAGSPSGSRPWFVATERDQRRILLAFGSAATASAGMCVFHAKDPLGYALDRARAMEQKAKKEGRDRLGIAVMRRSGQESEAVIPFDETLVRVLALAQWFARYRVSRSLHVLMATEIATLHAEAGGSVSDLFPVARELVRRVVNRRLVEDDAAREALWDQVSKLGEALYPGVKESLAEPVLRSWCDAVSIAEFLARPYDRRED